jgi:hypothetical protein
MDEPVSWLAIAPGAVVVAADGSEVGTVKEVAGDEEHDIFDGLVLSAGMGRATRYLAAERVTRIAAQRVETSLTAEEAAGLPSYQEPVSVDWRADERRGLGARLRDAMKDLFGRR